MSSSDPPQHRQSPTGATTNDARRGPTMLARRTRAALCALGVILAFVVAPRAALAQDVLLGVRVTGMGGAVTTNPSGAFAGCSNLRCYQSYRAGTVVRLIPTPGQQSTFARWLGACFPGPSSCALVLNQPRTTTTARFGPVPIMIAPTTGQGTVTASPAGASCGFQCMVYPYGTAVTLTAQACCGYALAGWGQRCFFASGNDCRVAMFDTVVARARFDCAGTDCVGASESPLSTDVKIKIRIHGSGGVQINRKVCRQPGCAITFTRDQPLFLRPRASGSRFQGWTGACVRAGVPCQLAAELDPVTNRAPIVGANFG